MGRSPAHALSPPLSSLPVAAPLRRTTRRPVIVGSNRNPASLAEVRVCTNRTCRKQGSLETFHTLTSLAPPEVTVRTCGCLGRCGSGPNLALLPEGIIVSHCGTAARAARVISSSNGDDGDGEVLKMLEALVLRKRAEAELEKGHFSQSEILFTQAINLKQSGGIHTMYKNRSVARLALSNYSGALEDAKEASALAPNYPEAYICEGDVYFAIDQFDRAEKLYSLALEIDPSLRRSKSFKARVEKIHLKATAADVS
ncbi:hypothetical protein MLD38_040026 [Melastoma candidum]|uniref:Uncharacterized protein n=1 Tax=Melastoma candidum TaxID=119954 RepID=A0ACB9L4R1_9MYRT|nr:hypothetical protein MLD38_040026 [Melastoma candidum]